MGEAGFKGEITRERILEHLESVLRSSEFVGSLRHSSLLRYLVDRTLSEEATHEIDIAVDVFGKDQTYDPTESSSVRVSVHQVRKKLEAYYAAHGPSEIRLSIPKGCYRVSFGVPLLGVDSPADGAESSVPRSFRYRWLAAACVLLLLASLGANLLLLLPQPKAATEMAPDRPLSFAFRELAEGPEPILIGLGDVFFFAERRANSGARYVRDVQINSLEDLRKLTGDTYGSSVLPSRMTYLPKSTAFALEAVLPIARATGKKVTLKLMSDVTAEDLLENDVIYIGLLRSMGILQDYFFRVSNFSIKPPFLSLYKKGTGEMFTWSGHLFGPTKDYGLFSSMEGPGKGKIFVVTGLSGIGMLQAVRTLTAVASAREVENRVRTELHDIPGEFEILFEVSGYDRAGLEAKTVDVAAIDPAQ